MKMSEAHKLSGELLDPIVKAFPKAAPLAGAFGQCALAAMLATAPAYMQALMSCLAGAPKPPASDYEPGDRARCG